MPIDICKIITAATGAVIFDNGSAFINTQSFYEILKGDKTLSANDRENIGLYAGQFDNLDGRLDGKLSLFLPNQDASQKIGFANRGVPRNEAREMAVRRANEFYKVYIDKNFVTPTSAPCIENDKPWSKFTELKANYASNFLDVYDASPTGGTSKTKLFEDLYQGFYSITKGFDDDSDGSLNDPESKKLLLNYFKSVPKSAMDAILQAANDPALLSVEKEELALLKDNKVKIDIGKFCVFLIIYLNLGLVPRSIPVNDNALR